MALTFFFMLLCLTSYIDSFELPLNFVFNGSSCSGKTTLAQEITKTWNQKHIRHTYFSIDNLYRSLLNSLTTQQQNDLPLLIARAKQQSKTHPAIAIELWPDYMNQLFNKWFNTYFSHINNHEPSVLELICDHDLIYQRFLHSWKNHGKPDLCFIQVQCTKTVALERLRLRNSSDNHSEHRDPDTVEANFNTLETIHGKKVYDLSIDTSTKDPQQLAQLVLASSYSTIATHKNFELYYSEK